MHTIITKRGQTVVPAAIRKRYQIRDGDGLEWLDDGSAVIRVVPIASDPIRALRGAGRGEGLTQRLLEERARDREREL